MYKREREGEEGAILAEQETLKFVGASCLFIAGKLTSQRRLKIDVARACVAQEWLDGEGESSSHALRRRLKDETTKWLRGLEKWEQGILVSFGFMVASIVEGLPQQYLLPLAKNIIVGKEDRQRVVELASALCADGLQLPLSHVSFSGWEVAVSAFTVACRFLGHAVEQADDTTWVALTGIHSRRHAVLSSIFTRIGLMSRTALDDP